MSFDITKIIILLDYYTKVLRDLFNNLLGRMGKGELGEDVPEVE